MASKSLGTLTIDLIAKTGGFVSGLSKAERASDNWRRQIQRDAADTAKSLATVGGAATALAGAVGVAGFQLLKSTSKQIADTDRWAKSLNISTQELMAWQFAAEKAGVSGDNMADIFKDIGDKIGDAVLNKSGEAVDALDALGLSADKLSKTSPDKQLLAIGEALGKIKTNAEKTTILESMGNDLSKLLPLFDNNNEKLKQFIQLSKDYGVAPEQSQIDDLIKVNSLFEEMEAQLNGLKIEIASGIAKVDLSGLTQSFDKVHSVLTDPKVLQGITDLVSEVAELAGWIITIAAKAGEIAALTGNRASAISGNINTSDLDQVNERITYLQKSMDNFSEGGSLIGRILGVDASREKAKNELTDLIKLRDQLTTDRAPKLPTQLATVGTVSSEFSNNGISNGKDKVDSAAKSLQNSFKSMDQSYQRQIALIDTSGQKTLKVTELEKLHFDLSTGKLSGLNDAQKQRLEQLATEVDRLNAVKKANEDNLKLAEFTSNLLRENENAAASLNADIIGADQGDKQRQRMQERLEIERSFLEQQRDLERQLQSGDLDKSLYDQKTDALRDALSQRLAMQEDHYKKLDNLQANWEAGAKNGFANWADDASNYYSQVSDLTESTMTGLVDNLSDALSGSKVDWSEWSKSVLQSLQKVLLNAVLVDSMKSLGGAAAGQGGALGSLGSWLSGAFTANAKGGVYSSSDLSQYSGQIVNSPTMFAFAKGAGLMGEAGPEAIMPLTRASDGSLGVRMVGDIQPAAVTGAGSTTIQQTIHVSGNGDAALKTAMQQAARQGAADGAKQARQEMLQDFSTRGQGRKLLGV
jgi:lambda family phage tail tape measure protein